MTVLTLTLLAVAIGFLGNTQRNHARRIEALEEKNLASKKAEVTP